MISLYSKYNTGEKKSPWLTPIAVVFGSIQKTAQRESSSSYAFVIFYYFFRCKDNYLYVSNLIPNVTALTEARLLKTSIGVNESK